MSDASIGTASGARRSRTRTERADRASHVVALVLGSDAVVGAWRDSAGAWQVRDASLLAPTAESPSVLPDPTGHEPSTGDAPTATRPASVDASLVSSLVTCLARWQESWPTAPHEIRLALAAPWTELRRVALPPVDDDDAQRLLVRAAARHFRTVAAPVVVGVASRVEASPLEDAEAPGARVVAATSAALLEVLRTRVLPAGCTVSIVVPAHAVLRPATGDGVVEAPLGDASEQVTWRDGVPVAVRRARTDAVGATTWPQWASHVARTLAKASPDELSALPLRLTAADPAARAAREHARGARRARQLAAAALLLLGAGALYRHGLARELAAVRAERAALTADLTRYGLRGDDPRTAWRAVADAAEARVPWANVLGALALALPSDASLDALHVRGDTLELAGRAGDAGRVYAALDSAGFTDLATAAPVRRERDADGNALDRFLLRATVPDAWRTGASRAAERR